MFTSLTLKRKFAPTKKVQQSAEAVEQPGAQRFVLAGGHNISSARQPVRLPQGFRRLRIVAGSAYVSYNQQDYVLYCGTELTLTHGSADAVISSLGVSTLIFDAIP